MLNRHNIHRSTFTLNETRYELDWDIPTSDLRSVLRSTRGTQREEVCEQVIEMLEKRLRYLRVVIQPLRNQGLDEAIFQEWVSECEEKLAICYEHLPGGIEC
jgi:hypothetical protein